MCPLCNHNKTKVLETRFPYRRRECLNCKNTWWTKEVYYSEDAKEHKK